MSEVGIVVTGRLKDSKCLIFFGLWNEKNCRFWKYWAWSKMGSEKSVWAKLVQIIESDRIRVIVIKHAKNKGVDEIYKHVCNSNVAHVW